MKRKFDASTPSSESSTNNTTNKHVKFNHHDNQPPSPSSKHTLESIREAKSLRKIKQQKGFEDTTSILGQTTERHDGLEGEEGNLNEERFIEEEVVMEPFHLQREREEGLFRDDADQRTEHERKKKRKEHAILRRAVNQDSDDDEDGDDSSEDEERDEWANDLEEMKPSSIVSSSSSKKKEESKTTTTTAVPSIEQCNECLVRLLNDRKETVSSALKRLRNTPSERDELIRHVNALISHHGQYDAYDRKRSSFQRTVQWQYKVRGSDEVHGPYPTRDIQSWIDQGYFDDNVTLRIYSPHYDDDDNSPPFKNLQEFDFTRFN